MKRASYREAVRWIAHNDSGGGSDALNPEIVMDLITAAMVADIFDMPPGKVGADIVKYRKSQPEWDALRSALSALDKEAAR